MARGVVDTQDFLELHGTICPTRTKMLSTITAIYDVECFFGAIFAPPSPLEQAVSLAAQSKSSQLSLGLSEFGLAAKGLPHFMLSSSEESG